MDTASLPNVLIMCLVFSSYMNVYCLIRAGSVCDYGCVFLYSFQWKILQLPRIFFFLPLPGCLCSKNLPAYRWGSFWNVGIQPPKILSLWNSSNDNVKSDGLWKNCLRGKVVVFFVFIFLNLSFRKKLRETFVSFFEETDVCMFVSILHHIQCFQMSIKWIKIN